MNQTYLAVFTGSKANSRRATSDALPEHPRSALHSGRTSGIVN
jgi:hypothetical protein